MDTFSWATKSPPRPVEELRSPVVQRLRAPDELFFRKSFRHVNNDSDPAVFSIHLFSESFIHIPGIFIQNLSETVDVLRVQDVGLPDNAYAANERNLLVRDAVSRLPWMYRSVVELCDFECVPMKEAA
jgi:DNA-directed RNA polymerase specialized sigma24 family protein